MTVPPAEEQWLTPGEVAARFRVNPGTVRRWALAHKVRTIRTYGGHRRYAAADIDRAIRDST